MSIVNRPKGKGLPTSKGFSVSRSEYDDILLRRNSRAENKMSKDSYFFDRAQKVISKDYTRETKLIQQKVGERGGQNPKFATGYRQIPSVSSRDKGPTKYRLKNGEGYGEFSERQHACIPLHGSRIPSGGKNKGKNGKPIRSVQSSAALSEGVNNNGYQFYGRRGSDGAVPSRNELLLNSRDLRRASEDVGQKDSSVGFLKNGTLSSDHERDSTWR